MHSLPSELYQVILEYLPKITDKRNLLRTCKMFQKIHRQCQIGDFLVVFIDITKKGEELAENLKQCYLDYLNSVFNKVPKNEQEALIKSLYTLLSSFEQHRYVCANVQVQE